MGPHSQPHAADAASPSKVCFEDEAEVVPADKPLYFDAPGCVHADRPQAVSVLDGNSFTDPDPEASSLVGSVRVHGVALQLYFRRAGEHWPGHCLLHAHTLGCMSPTQDDEYAFVYERPAGVDSPAKDGAATDSSGSEPAQVSLPGPASRPATLPVSDCVGQGVCVLRWTAHALMPPGQQPKDTGVVHAPSEPEPGPTIKPEPEHEPQPLPDPEPGSSQDVNPQPYGA